jgi:hypothetical protein
LADRRLKRINITASAVLKLDYSGRGTGAILVANLKQLSYITLSTQEGAGR